MADLIYSTSGGAIEIGSEEMKGVGDILEGISDELQSYCDKANAIHDGARNEY